MTSKRDERYARLEPLVPLMLNGLLVHLDLEIQDADQEDLLQAGRMALLAYLAMCPATRDGTHDPLFWISQHLLDELAALTHIQVDPCSPEDVVARIEKLQANSPDEWASTWEIGMPVMNLESDLPEE